MRIQRSSEFADFRFTRKTRSRIFYQLVTHPTFPKEVDRERELMLASLKRLADRPGEFANLVYGRVIYGEHPIRA